MRLERHILIELFFNFAFALAAVNFVAAIFIVVQVFFTGDLPMISAAMAAPLLLLAKSELLTPCAFLLGVVFTYGRLAAELEYMASQACGVHPLRVVGPVVLMGLVLSFLQWLVLSYVMPNILVRADQLTDELALQVFERLEPGRTEFDASKAGFYMNWARRNGMTLEDVVIDAKGRVNDSDGRGEPATVRGHAQKVEVVPEPGVIRFWIYGFETAGHGGTARFGKLSLTISKDKLRESATFRPKTDFYTSDFLLALGIRKGHEAARIPDSAPASPEARLRTRARDQARDCVYQFHRRAAWSFAPLLLGLLGAPVSIWLRKGTRLTALVLAFGIFLLVYFPLAKIGGDGLADVAAIPAGASAWLATAVCGSLASVLLRRLVRR